MGNLRQMYSRLSCVAALWAGPNMAAESIGSGLAVSRSVPASLSVGIGGTLAGSSPAARFLSTAVPLRCFRQGFGFGDGRALHHRKV